MKKLLEILNKWSEIGIKFPFAYDKSTEGPSVTLLFFYLFSTVALVSVITLHFRTEPLMASMTAICAWVISYVCYRIRKIDKFKFDLDDKSIEIDSESDKS